MITASTGEFPVEYVPTVFDNYAMKYDAGGTMIYLGLFDTHMTGGGGEDYHRLRPLSYPQTDVVLMCYDVGSVRSFDNIAEYWLPETMVVMPDVYAPLPCLARTGSRAHIRPSSCSRREEADGGGGGGVRVHVSVCLCGGTCDPSRVIKGVYLLPRVYVQPCVF